MINRSSIRAGAAISSGTRRVLAIDPIEGADGVLSLTAVYRHFAPEADRFDLHSFRFRYTTNREGEYLLGLDEWWPPERTVSALDLGMLAYVEVYFASYDVHVSVSIPVVGTDDGADSSSTERFANNAELRISER